MGQARACLSLAERQLADVRGAAQYDGKDDDVANLEMALKETRDALASLEVGKRGEAARVDCAMPYFHRLAARAVSVPQEQGVQVQRKAKRPRTEETQGPETGAWLVHETVLLRAVSSLDDAGHAVPAAVPIPSDPGFATLDAVSEEVLLRVRPDRPGRGAHPRNKYAVREPDFRKLGCAV